MSSPITHINGVPLNVIPSGYVYKLEDVSDSEAGRTEDLVMHKKRVGQVIGIDIEWNAISIADCATVLTMFNPEYINITYLDAKAGGYVTSEFYVGDRSAPLYNCTLGIWEKLSFSCIKRAG
jgi:hypothetical protein